jgi:hypothetical protein
MEAMTLHERQEAVWLPTETTNRMRPSLIVSLLTVSLTTGIGILALWLAFISLRWPLLGDATLWHFAAEQFSLGAVPYRDFIDMNMPLIYAIHAAVIAIGGMGDLTFRVFDLGSSVVIGALAAALVWPAGRSLGILAALSIVTTHLLFNLFEHLSRDEFCRVLEILHHKLSANGTINILQPNYRYAYREYFDDYTHILVFSHISLADFLKANGFEVIEVRPRFLPLTVKSRLPVSPWLIGAYLVSQIKPLAKQMLLRARVSPDSALCHL